MDFDTEDEVVALQDRVRQRVLVDATMPVGGGVYDDDLVLLEALLDCGLEEGR